MTESEVSNEQIEAFIGSLEKTFKATKGKNIIIVGVGPENEKLARS